ncbi:uncharacterized protein LOC114717473 [Neltuma alba]|uniref:uncharacterized protein LOC114717473 n=1 Tax=Neltuma alba TaxID=207710 RepID=UPI0010A36989|nr:uncharacterized protein LOC114717473 [Prosopis alba]
MDVLTTRHSLYHSTLQGDWQEALAIYKNNVSIIHDAAINSSGDTVLHTAVNDDRGDMVEKLVTEIPRSGSLSAPQKKNDRGDTPLHRAASRGSLEMYKCIAEAERNTQLIEARNKEGETPLFLAALHGHMDAFLYLHSCCPDPSSRLWKRSSDGETILHCTIRPDHFGLAFEIIRLYGEHIVGSVDEKGVTSLHILAEKPSAFESSSNFRWYNKLVYNCIHVKSLRSLEQYPKNDPWLWIKSSERQRTQTGADAENPSYDGYENVWPNYWTCFDIFSRAFTFVIWPVVKTLGFRVLKDLEIKKQRHVWCRQILDRLWENKDVAYVGGGSALQSSALVHGTTGGESSFPRPSGLIVDKQDKKTEEAKIVEFIRRLQRDKVLAAAPAKIVNPSHVLRTLSLRAIPQPPVDKDAALPRIKRILPVKQGEQNSRR